MSCYAYIYNSEILLADTGDVIYAVQLFSQFIKIYSTYKKILYPNVL